MPAAVTFLLPHYPPDVAADGQLFSQLARELAARGHEVRVATFKPGYQEMALSAPGGETRDGVKISRWWAPRAGKSLLSRIWRARWIAGWSMWRALFASGGHTLIIPSSPPTLGMAAWYLWWLRRQPYIYVLHDIHPDLGEALGRWRHGGFLSAVLNRINRRVFKRAHAVVTLSERMAENARRKQPRARIEVIENWADLDKIAPRAKADSQFAQANGLVTPFVLQYSGNLGLLHPLDALTRATGDLATENVVLTYIGRGARLNQTKEIAKGYSNVRFFDYQPLESLCDSLIACDVAVVTLEAGVDGLAMPSKLTGILASGRPLIALVPKGSEIAALVEKEGVGAVVTEVNDAESVAAAIRRMRHDPDALAEMGRRARELAERRFSLQRAVEAYERLL
ncbi:MAG: glycosyltransferase family 4 protein [Planctomycetes bacterium]|nr:glycosyltransferase family 4 protein [Planctomycetota bacterium]